MEDDIRKETNRLGFCEKHVYMINQESNRLGLALILQTHIKTVHDKIIKESKSRFTNKKSKNGDSSLSQLINETLDTCYICDTIDVGFNLYMDTIIYLYKKDPDFRILFEGTKGYCMKHFAILYDQGLTKLKGIEQDSYIKTIMDVYQKNMDTIQENMDWFVRKFDYRFKDSPWNGAKTAIPKALRQIASYNTNSTKK
jgi:hypothetical protein